MRNLMLALTLLAFADAATAHAGPFPQTRPAPTVKAPAEPDMTNVDVLRLARAGFSDTLLVARIRAAKKPVFDLSSAALLELKEAGVSEAVVAAMIDPTAPALAAAPVPDTRTTDPKPAPRNDPTDPLAPHRPGIYVDVGTATPELVELEPTVFTQGKTGGLFTSALTWGLVKAKWKALINGAGAVRRVSSRQPAFYFYFQDQEHPVGTTAGSLASAASPNEFVLARMTPKGNRRELVVGEIGALGANSGTRSEDTADVEIEKLAPGVYRVRPAVPLYPGEYCFFHTAAAASANGGVSGRLFDFGIDGTEERDSMPAQR